MHGCPVGFATQWVHERYSTCLQSIPVCSQDACKRSVEVAKSQGKSITKLALQFSTSNPGIATTLVGMASPEIVSGTRSACSSLPSTCIPSHAFGLLNEAELCRSLLWGLKGLGSVVTGQRKAWHSVLSQLSCRRLPFVLPR